MKITVSKLIELLTPYPDANVFISHFDSDEEEDVVDPLDHISIVLDANGAASVTLEA